MLTLWNIIKKIPGTVAIVIATILGVVILSIMFPERSQLLAMLAVVTLVPLVAFRIRKEAGFIVTALVVVALAFWGPSMVREFNRASNPNGTFASFFAKAKEQTLGAIGLYKPGAIGQASLLSGVMASDAKLSANIEKQIIHTGSTIDDTQMTLKHEQIDSMFSAAGAIKTNQEVFGRILAAGGMNAVLMKSSAEPDTIQVDVKDSSPKSVSIPKGHDAMLTVRFARYNCGAGYYGASGCGVTPVLSESTYPTAFVAPNLSAWATLYRINGGEWHVLQDGVNTYIKGNLESDTEVEFVVNDRTTTFDNNIGDCVIGYQNIPMGYASL